MAAKNGWNKFTHMKQIYFTVTLCTDDTDGGQQLLRSTFSRDRVIRLHATVTDRRDHATEMLSGRSSDRRLTG